MRLVHSQESVGLFRLRTSSAGLLEDKKRGRMVSDERYIMCDRVGEDVAHFLVSCEEFERDWMMCTKLWRLDEFRSVLGKWCK